ncbi:hypothetical protein GE09DRAFT_335268 [Coniochaeta sp. 2T2.1]|nr:hypothetical protein GE09DRAFT_335268 [Coniochaeta sp. 2T2.1]
MTWWDGRHDRTPPLPWRKQEPGTTMYILSKREGSPYAAGILSPIVATSASTSPPLSVEVSVSFTDPVIRSQYNQSYGSSAHFHVTDDVCDGVLRHIEEHCADLLTRKDAGALDGRGDEVTNAPKRQRYGITFRILRRGTPWRERTFRSYQKQPLTVNFTKQVVAATGKIVEGFVSSHDSGAGAMPPSPPLSPFAKASLSSESGPGYTIRLFLTSHTLLPARELKIYSDQDEPLTLALAEQLFRSISASVQSTLAGTGASSEGAHGDRADDVVTIDLRVTNNHGPVYDHLRRVFYYPEPEDADACMMSLERQIQHARDVIDDKISLASDMELRQLELNSPSWSVREALNTTDIDIRPKVETVMDSTAVDSAAEAYPYRNKARAGQADDAPAGSETSVTTSPRRQFFLLNRSVTTLSDGRATSNRPVHHSRQSSVVSDASGSRAFPLMPTKYCAAASRRNTLFGLAPEMQPAATSTGYSTTEETTATTTASKLELAPPITLSRDSLALPDPEDILVCNSLTPSAVDGRVDCFQADDNGQQRQALGAEDEQATATAPSTPPLSSGAGSSPRYSVIMTPTMMRTQTVLNEGVLPLEYAKDGVSEEDGHDTPEVHDVQPAHRPDSTYTVRDLRVTVSYKAPLDTNDHNVRTAESSDLNIPASEPLSQLLAADTTSRDPIEPSSFMEYSFLSEAELEVAEASMVELPSSPTLGAVRSSWGYGEDMDSSYMDDVSFSFHLADRVVDVGEHFEESEGGRSEGEDTPELSVVSRREVMDPVETKVPDSPEAREDEVDLELESNALVEENESLVEEKGMSFDEAPIEVMEDPEALHETLSLQLQSFSDAMVDIGAQNEEAQHGSLVTDGAGAEQHEQDSENEQEHVTPTEASIGNCSSGPVDVAFAPEVRGRKRDREHEHTTELDEHLEMPATTDRIDWVTHIETSREGASSVDAAVPSPPSPSLASTLVDVAENVEVEDDDEADLFLEDNVDHEMYYLNQQDAGEESDTSTTASDVSETLSATPTAVEERPSPETPQSDGDLEAEDFATFERAQTQAVDVAGGCTQTEALEERGHPSGAEASAEPTSSRPSPQALVEEVVDDGYGSGDDIESMVNLAVFYCNAPEEDEEDEEDTVDEVQATSSTSYVPEAVVSDSTGSLPTFSEMLVGDAYPESQDTAGVDQPQPEPQAANVPYDPEQTEISDESVDPAGEVAIEEIAASPPPLSAQVPVVAKDDNSDIYEAVYDIESFVGHELFYTGDQEEEEVEQQAVASEAEATATASFVLQTDVPSPLAAQMPSLSENRANAASPEAEGSPTVGRVQAHSLESKASHGVSRPTSEEGSAPESASSTSSPEQALTVAEEEVVGDGDEAAYDIESMVDHVFFFTKHQREDVGVDEAPVKENINPEAIIPDPSTEQLPAAQGVEPNEAVLRVDDITMAEQLQRHNADIAYGLMEDDTSYNNVRPLDMAEAEPASIPAASPEKAARVIEEEVLNDGYEAVYDIESSVDHELFYLMEQDEDEVREDAGGVEPAFTADIVREPVLPGSQGPAAPQVHQEGSTAEVEDHDEHVPIQAQDNGAGCTPIEPSQASAGPPGEAAVQELSSPPSPEQGLTVPEQDVTGTEEYEGYAIGSSVDHELFYFREQGEDEIADVDGLEAPSSGSIVVESLETPGSGHAQLPPDSQADDEGGRAEDVEEVEEAVIDKDPMPVEARAETPDSSKPAKSVYELDISTEQLSSELTTPEVVRWSDSKHAELPPETDSNLVDLEVDDEGLLESHSQYVLPGHEELHQDETSSANLDADAVVALSTSRGRSVSGGLPSLFAPAVADWLQRPDHTSPGASDSDEHSHPYDDEATMSIDDSGAETRAQDFFNEQQEAEEFVRPATPITPSREIQNPFNQLSEMAAKSTDEETEEYYDRTPLPPHTPRRDPFSIPTPFSLRTAFSPAAPSEHSLSPRSSMSSLSHHSAILPRDSVDTIDPPSVHQTRNSVDTIDPTRDSVDTIAPLPSSPPTLSPQRGVDFSPSTAGWLGFHEAKPNRRFSMPLQHVWDPAGSSSEKGWCSTGRPATPTSNATTVRQYRRHKKRASLGPRPMTSGALESVRVRDEEEDGDHEHHHRKKAGVLPKFVMLFAGKSFASKFGDAEGRG